MLLSRHGFPGRHHLLAFLAVSFLGASSGANAEWTRVGGPEPPVAAALTQHDGLYLLGTGEADAGDLFASNDTGLTWFDAGFPNGGVNALFGHEGVLFVGSYLFALHRSTDGGETWEPADDGMQGSPSIGAFMASGPSIFAATGGLAAGPIYRSENLGESWTVIGGTPSVEWVCLFRGSTALFAGSSQSGLYRSTNGGSTWQPVSGGIPANARIGGIVETGSALYAGVSVPTTPSALGLYRSADNGSTWSKVSNDLPSVLQLGFTDLELDGTTFFASLSGSFGAGGLYRSTNQGVNWTKISSSLPVPGDSSNLDALSLTVESNLVLLGTPLGVYRTTDQGETWADSNAGASAIRGVGSFLAEGTTLFTGLQTNGQLGRGLWRTTDGAESWTKLGATTGLGENPAIWALTRHEGDLFAGVYGFPRGVYRSTDDGVNWEFTSSGISGSTIIWAMHSTPGALLTGAHEALYRSTNQGTSWSTVPGMNEVTSFASFGAAIFAGTEDSGVFRSTNAGASWTTMSNGLPNSWIYALVENGGSLFAATNGNGVYRFDGTSWHQSGLGNAFLLALQSVGSALLASSALDGAFLSTDHGETWVPFNQGFWGGEIWEFAWADDRVWIGTRGHGIWTRPVSEVLTASSVDDVLDSAFAPMLQLEDSTPLLGTDARLRYVLPRDEAAVRLSVFDVSGRSILSSDLGRRGAGGHDVVLDITTWPSGVYLARLEAGGTTTLRMVRVR